jgi:hypothetical protein
LDEEGLFRVDIFSSEEELEDAYEYWERVKQAVVSSKK